MLLPRGDTCLLRSHSPARTSPDQGELLGSVEGNHTPTVAAVDAGQQVGLTPSPRVPQAMSQLSRRMSGEDPLRQGTPALQGILSDSPSFLSFTISWSLLKIRSSNMPSNHLILCHPLLLLPSIFPSIRVFSNESHQVAKVLELQLQHQSFQ